MHAQELDFGFYPREATSCAEERNQQLGDLPMAKNPKSAPTRVTNDTPAGTKDNGKVRIGYGSPCLPPSEKANSACTDKQ